MIYIYIYVYNTIVLTCNRTYESWKKIRPRDEIELLYVLNHRQPRTPKWRGRADTVASVFLDIYDNVVTSVHPHLQAGCDTPRSRSHSYCYASPKQEPSHLQEVSSSFSTAFSATCHSKPHRDANLYPKEKHYSWYNLVVYIHIKKRCIY